MKGVLTELIQDEPGSSTRDDTNEQSDMSHESKKKDKKTPTGHTIRDGAVVAASVSISV